MRKKSKLLGIVVDVHIGRRNKKKKAYGCCVCYKGEILTKEANSIENNFKL